MAEIDSVKKQLADIEQKLGASNQTLQSVLADAQSAMDRILTNKAVGPPGLENAYKGLATALLVIENSDRAIPPQAIALYKESSGQVKAGIGEWKQFKQTRLPQLSQQLRESNLGMIVPK